MRIKKDSQWKWKQQNQTYCWCILACKYLGPTLPTIQLFKPKTDIEDCYLGQFIRLHTAFLEPQKSLMCKVSAAPFNLFFICQSFFFFCELLHLNSFPPAVLWSVSPGCSGCTWALSSGLDTRDCTHGGRDRCSLSPHHTRPGRGRQESGICGAQAQAHTSK